MINIITTTKEDNEGNLHAICTIKRMSGTRTAVTAELASMLETIDDNFPGMIGDALELLIESVRRQL